MARFCPYLGRDSTEPFNCEHVVPESIGGGRDFSIQVHEHTNSTIGGRVDQPFVDNDIVKYLRYVHKVRGKKGELVQIDIPADVEVRSRKMRVIRRLVPDRAMQVLPSQEVEYIPGKVERGWLLTFTAMSTEECERMHEEFRRKVIAPDAARFGGESFIADVETLQLTVEGPTTHPAEMNGGTVYRFMAKIALGASYRLFGEAWGRSMFAEELRRVVNGSIPATIERLAGRAFRAPDPFLSAHLATPFHADANEHVVGFFTGHDGAVWCVMTIFHYLGAMFRVKGGLVIPPVAWGLNFTTKGVRELLLRPEAAPLVVR